MFLIYYKEYCPYSINAESLLVSKKIDYKKIIVDSNNFSLKDQFREFFYHSTFPVIFNINEYNVIYETNIPKTGFIGGYDRINDIYNYKNKLANLKENQLDDIKKYILSKNIEYKTILKTLIDFLNYK